MWQNESLVSGLRVIGNENVIALKGAGLGIMFLESEIDDF